MRETEEHSDGAAREGGASTVRRFAIVVIAEAPSGTGAKRMLKEHLGAGDACWLVEACPVGPAVTYEVIELRLIEDGEPVVTAPES